MIIFKLNVRGFIKTKMLKVNHKELKTLVNEYYKKKISLLVYGTFGIGKSYSVRDSAKALGEERAREFVEWNKLTNEKRQEVFEYPEKYFVLMDIRLSEFDSSDIKGLPDFKGDRESIEWKIPFWAKFLEKENSDGILFFDELNLAPPLVISSVYKIIYDRVINEGKLSDNWLIIGCGNLSEDRAYTHDLAPPVRDRGGEVELTIPNSEDWIDWAIDNQVDSRIIGFINFKPSALNSVDYDDKQKFTTNRGWERLNSLITGVKDYKILNLVCSSAIGEGIAKEFVAFCKIKEQIDFEGVLKNPEKLKNVTEISVKYFVLTAFADNYNEKKVDFDKIVKVSEVLDETNNAEFVALLWRLCIKYQPIRFKKDFEGGKLPKKIKEKYIKYLI